MLPTSANGPPTDERRTAARFACKPQLFCRVIDPLDESMTTAGPWNLSRRGACVIIEPHFAPGRHVEIAFHIPANGSSMYYQAEVVHTVLIPSLREMWLTGCSFCDGPVPEEELQPCL
jgi:hypothetical protein